MGQTEYCRLLGGAPQTPLGGPVVDGWVEGMSRVERWIVRCPWGLLGAFIQDTTGGSGWCLP